MELRKEVYTAEEVLEIVEKVRMNLKNEMKQELLIRTYFESNSYHVNEILKHENFLKTKNILSVSYDLRNFVELCEAIGFDKLNEEFVKRAVDNREV